MDSFPAQLALAQKSTNSVKFFLAKDRGLSYSHYMDRAECPVPHEHQPYQTTMQLYYFHRDALESMMTTALGLLREAGIEAGVPLGSTRLYVPDGVTDEALAHAVGPRLAPFIVNPQNKRIAPPFVPQFISDGGRAHSCPLCDAGIPVADSYEVKMADGQILITKCRELATLLMSVPREQRIFQYKPLQQEGRGSHE